MKRIVRVLELVYEEISEAVLYYEEQQEGLGLALLDDWENVVLSIRKAPEGYEKKHKDFRQAMLQKFPYLIMFEVDTAEIVIYHFIHFRRLPAKRYSKK